MEGSQKWSTPKYRAVGHTSTIDESLFGGGDTKGMSQSKRRTVTGPIPPTAAVISASELIRIKNQAVIKTEQEIQADREEAQRIKEERDKLSKQRKDRMKELEKRAVLLAKKSDSEVAEIAKKQQIREAAEKQIDDSLDAVKLLNSMAARATAYSIRDQQLEEKKRIEHLEKEIDRRSDIMIEIDRLKSIQQREEEERYKRSKRLEDRKVINDQIEGRRRARLLELEAREQENQAMRNLMKKYEDEDAVKAERHRIEVEKARLEVIKANEDAIFRKQDAKNREKKEVEDILIYQAMRDAEMKRREDEEAAVDRSKKERQAKLLAEQEKAQCNAGKMDELRARRAAEEKERAERAREKAEAIKRKKEMKELLDSRAKQAEDKLRLQQEAKFRQQDMIRDALIQSQRLEEREENERRMKAARSEEHRVKLQRQIDERERQRRDGRTGTTDEGSNIRQDLIREEARLKVIRDQMVTDLVSQGVNPKYLSEMKNVDIGKILKR